LGKVFNVVSLVIVTTFPEEAVMYHVMDIQLVEKWVTIL